MTTWGYAMGLVGLLASLATSRPAAAAEVEGSASPHGPGDRRNSLTLSTHAKIPDWANALTYHRALGKRLSLSAGVEYTYQALGYWHLQGVGENVAGQLWLGRAFHGVFAEASLSVSHQFLVRLPRLSSTAMAPGLGLGYRWTHRSGLTVGGSAGLRWNRVVSASPLVCSRPKYCSAVREGPIPRITFDIGYVF